jgi:beta-glucosidase
LYGESIFVGYRYFEKKRIKPLFPFGHGLSYTTFSYGDIKTDKSTYRDDEQVTVTLDVTNTGKAAGKEIVQLYVQPIETERPILRPLKELKAFEKITLVPGETKTISLTLGFRAFAWYDADIKDWRVETGKYNILAAASSEDVRCFAEISVQSTYVQRTVITRDTLMSTVWAIPQGKAFLAGILAKVQPAGKAGETESDREAYLKMVLAMPVKALHLVGVPAEQVDAFIAGLNALE